MDFKENAKNIQAQFEKLGAKVELSEIETKLKQLVNDFRVPDKEASKTVISMLLKKYNIAKQDFYKGLGAEEIKIETIKEAEKWINLHVKVVQLWDANSETIAQVGLIGDETGTIKFTKWAKAGLSAMEEGKSYHLKNIVTSEWQGQYSVNFNKTSVIIPLQYDVEVSSKPVEFSGAMVDIQSGSGLIKRCPECNRALSKGSCGEHGRVEGIYDLRIKAVLDNGEAVQEILLNREATEALTGLTLDKAKDMVTEALDTAVITEAISQQLVGRYFKASGQKLDRFILVENIEKEV